uniref:PiggyBac transposable element-derived protein domain-containing protein n=1 Tax=Phytophthora ramorum TaxID=164328 RepID=H3GNY3_PHYRM
MGDDLEEVAARLSIQLILKKKKGEKKKPPKTPKNRPASIERGTFIVTDALQIPGMRLLRWWDTRAVHMLSTGGSVESDRIVRREKLTGEQQTQVACPRVVKDYQTFMGGVDVHDQLRLQRYSLQLCIKYKKYSKSLFLGLTDLAIINGYIVYDARRAAANLSKVRHVKFMKQLHLELCQLREEDLELLRSNENLQVTPQKTANSSRIRRSAHKPLQNDECRPGNNGVGRKRRTRACKICALLKGTDNARGGDSSVYSSKCKLPTTSKKPMAWRVFLCEKMRHAVSGQPMSCFGSWHKALRDGTLAPAPRRDGKKRMIRAQRPAESQVNEMSELEEEEEQA